MDNININYQVQINGPFDSKISNIIVTDNYTVKVETIPEYLARVTIPERVPGVIVTILSVKDGNPLIYEYDMDFFNTYVNTFEHKYYTFIDGIDDINFVEIPLNSPITEMSVTGDGTDLDPIRLVNDASVVSAYKYYGTGAQAEVKGFWEFDNTFIGPQGAQGPQGASGGPQGAQGPQGYNGAQGPQGYTGVQGPQGYTGVQGPQGTSGTQGYQGATGSQGPQGPQGYQGYNGTNGTQGPQGYQGYQGGAGSQGPQGANGVQGPQGSIGTQGSQGSQGSQGASGVNIYTGTQISHSFAIGDCIKPYITGWVKTLADSRFNAGTVAIVYDIIDSSTFTYIVGGLLPGAGSYTEGENYFLSTSVAGGIMTVSYPEIWTAGQVREFIGTGTLEGLMVELDVGDEIGVYSFDPSIGLPGPQGPAGAQGAQGATGSQGPQGASISAVQDISFEFADVVAGTAKEYTLDIKASYNYTIESACLETDNGTLTGVDVKIGATPVTSLSSLTVDTLVDEFTSTGANTVSIGNRVYLSTSTGYSGAPTLIRGKLNILRT